MKSHLVSRNINRTEMLMHAMILSSLNFMALHDFLYLSVIFKMSWMSLEKQMWNFSFLSLFWDSKSFLYWLSYPAHTTILLLKNDLQLQIYLLLMNNSAVDSINKAQNTFWNISLIQNLNDIAQFVTLGRQL